MECHASGSRYAVTYTHRRVKPKILLFPQIAPAVLSTSCLLRRRVVLAFSAATPIVPSFSTQNFLFPREMARKVSEWEESEMDAAKIQALVVAGKIPEKTLVKWLPAIGQHWPSGEDGQIPVF